MENVLRKGRALQLDGIMDTPVKVTLGFKCEGHDKIALAKEDSSDTFYKSKLATARFYFARLLPETAMLIRQARSGSANLMALEADLF